MVSFKPLQQNYDVEEDGIVQQIKEFQEGPSLCSQMKYCFNGTKSEILKRLWKYLILLRSFIPIPDIVMCLVTFYFIIHPPEYITEKGKVAVCSNQHL